MRIDFVENNELLKCKSFSNVEQLLKSVEGMHFSFWNSMKKNDVKISCIYINISLSNLMIVYYLLAKAFITFSYLEEEKVLFWGQIFEVEILMDLHVLRSPVYEKHIFSVWSVCM